MEVYIKNLVYYLFLHIWLLFIHLDVSIKFKKPNVVRTINI